ncbi:MAG: SPOR domain-containing protein [Deltaproteobacteria bacterium]|nr:SPOR domain-containing protein [Deltaproteobacteria bacterium]
MERAKKTELFFRNPRVGILPRKQDEIRLWLTIILTATFCLFFVPHFAQAKKSYYYIHVSSFRAKSNAVSVAEDLQKKGYSAVVRGEEVPKLGYWYRIYLGPFSAYKEAKITSDELKKRGLAKYTAIYQKDSPIREDMARAPRIEEKPAPVLPPPPKKEPPVTKKPGAVQPQKATVAEAKKAPPPVSPAPAKEPVKLKPEPRKEQPLWQRRGYGRNLAGGKFSLAWQHTYREVQTEVTDRNNGSVSGNEKYRFDTEMNLDMLRIGFGITDFLGLFADVGACYDDLDDFNLAYGGGGRLNLFEVKNGSMRGFYSALQAEYHKGKLETDYQSVGGNRFSKDADWWEFAGKGEVGLVRDRFALYFGATYFIYREDTDRKQTENTPPTVKYKDDLEEENSFGGYGGLSLHLTPGLLINLEGQFLTQNSIAAMVEYRF